MKHKINGPEDRLIIAIDLVDPEYRSDTQEARIYLKRTLGKLIPLVDIGRPKLTIKVESILGCGPEVLDDITSAGFKAFADTKVYATPHAAVERAKILGQYKPKFATIACDCGTESVRAFSEELPDTEILGVFSLTSEPCADLAAFWEKNPQLVEKVTEQVERGLLDGLVCSANHIPFLSARFGNRLSFVVTNVRCFGEEIEGDDQDPSRTSTPKEAFNLRATHIVMGRPITLAKEPVMTTRRILKTLPS